MTRKYLFSGITKRLGTNFIKGKKELLCHNSPNRQIYFHSWGSNVFLKEKILKRKRNNKIKIKVSNKFN